MHGTFYQRAFGIATAVALGYALWLILRPFAVPLFWAAFLAFMLYPLQRRLTVRFKGRRGVAAGLLTALTPIAILAPLSVIGSLFFIQAGGLVVRLRDFATRGDTGLLERLESFPVVGSALQWLQSRLQIDGARMQEWFLGAGENMLRSAASFGGNVLAGAIGTAVGFFMMLFILYFLLRDGERWMARPIRLIPMEPARRDELLDHLARVTRAVVYGSGVTALLQGIAVGVGFALAGLPSAVFFGVVAALMSLLPVTGAAIVWVPAVIYLAAAGSWGAAVFLLVWGAALSTADNFIRPWLVATQAPVPTLTVFIGVLGGAAAFGTLGVVVGPVLLTLVAALLQYADDKIGAPRPRGP